MQQFDFTIKHRPGKDIVQADALSRLSTMGDGESDNTDTDILMLMAGDEKRFITELWAVDDDVLPKEGDGGEIRRQPAAVKRRSHD